MYPNASVRSPGRRFELPSVIALREYRPIAGGRPAFTRFNVFLRDDFTCQVCDPAVIIFLVPSTAVRRALRFRLARALSLVYVHPLLIIYTEFLWACKSDWGVLALFSSTVSAVSTAHLPLDALASCCIVSTCFILTVLWPAVPRTGPHVRPRDASLSRRCKDLLDQHCGGLRVLQPPQGRSHPGAAVGGDEAPPQAGRAVQCAITGRGTPLPPALVPRDVARLPVLGHGAD